MYFFQGNERLMIGFHSPNLLACFIVMLLFTVLALLEIFLKHTKRFSGTITLVAVVMLTIFLFALSMTYSRGGYASLFASGIIVSFASWPRENDSMTIKNKWHLLLRYYACVLPLIFCMALLLTSSGWHRVRSSFDIGEASIANRLDLWKGGMCLIAERPLRGCSDIAPPGRIYAKWIQPLHKHESYRTLISDTLTITASYGIFAGFLFIVMGFFYVFSGVSIWRNSGNQCALLLSVSIFAFYVCGLFSTCHESGKIQLLLGFDVAILTLYIIRTRNVIKCRTCLEPSLVLAVAVIASLYICGIFYHSQLKWSLENIGDGVDSGNPFVACNHLEVVTKKEPKGDVWLFGEHIDCFLRRFALPAAVKGYNVHLRMNSGGIHGKSEFSDIMDKMFSAKDKVTILVAIGENVSNPVWTALAERDEFGSFWCIFNNINLLCSVPELSIRAKPLNCKVILLNNPEFAIDEESIKLSSKKECSQMICSNNDIIEKILDIIP